MKHVPPVLLGELDMSIPEAVKQLPARQREVVISFYYKGKTVPLIAEEMEITEHNVRVILSRAHASLKAYLLNS